MQEENDPNFIEMIIGLHQEPSESGFFYFIHLDDCEMSFFSGIRTGNYRIRFALALRRSIKERTSPEFEPSHWSVTIVAGQRPVCTAHGPEAPPKKT